MLFCLKYILQNGNIIQKFSNPLQLLRDNVAQAIANKILVSNKHGARKPPGPKICPFIVHSRNFNSQRHNSISEKLLEKIYFIDFNKLHLRL